MADLQMWTELESHAAQELHTFTGVYIGGGNTFTLLHLLRASGLDLALKQFALNGGATYGGSAGAILLEADIARRHRLPRTGRLQHRGAGRHHRAESAGRNRHLVSLQAGPSLKRACRPRPRSSLILCYRKVTVRTLGENTG